ncbi:hypothetical protein NN3_34270 [Nocardia neocaledoniensis NBRC 108232]|uniref:Immunity protein 35 of polymorphic toxin system n=1 Tax=Nocardia neocaledoniensis TaxID=236511 RepID=A0A317NVX8_9NOCA|nr:hypothetical protein [Nocardia neocaledoniensis]PWV79053.1 hypothetical protein DFR69_102111 [Nocardia neocaledoniensis]GEM32420.1 hypothetical protein NN3_34270 [Nocardia neocaledoniensis NBRC 108232]
MDIHAYPTDARTPVDQAEATRIAETRLPAPEPGTERHVAEFDDGFIVLAVWPIATPAGRSRPVGGSVHVIDKETGAVSYWPTYPYELIAPLYATGRLIVEDEWPEQDDRS